MIFNRRRTEPAPPEPDWDDPLYVPQPVERWIEPEEVAARQRRSRGRWRALRHAVVLLLIILVVGSVGLVAGGAVLGRWDLPWDLGPRAGQAAAGEPTAAPVDCEPALVTVASAEGTSVEVLNATTRNGLAGAVAEGMESRGFTVVGVGNYSGDVVETARILFPEGAESAALAVWVHMPGAQLVPDPSAETVTAILGDAWVGFAEREQVVELAQQQQPSVVDCAEGGSAGGTETTGTG